MTWFELAQTAGNLLKARGESVCTAESCTGGLLMSALTDIEGSSAYCVGGIIAYSNAIKTAQLGVLEATLLTYGAVSEPTARQMALGAQQALHATYALSVTGIAGPGGGTPEKPVGLVYIGCATPNSVHVERFIWTGNRIENKQASVRQALALLISLLKES